MIYLKTEERNKLIQALRNNITNPDNPKPIFMSRDTSFTDQSPTDDFEAIVAVRSLPTHY